MSFTRITAPTKKYPPIFPDKALYQTPDGLAFVNLAFQKTGFGTKNFLVCPVCGARRQYLYVINWKTVCRDHLVINGKFRGGAYNRIQYTTKGGADRIEYTMEKMSEKALIPFSCSTDYYDMIYHDRRPRYMRKFLFADLMARLYLLEDMREIAILATHPMFGKAALHPERNVPTIRAIERCKPGDLRGIRLYDDIMGFAQRRYKADWGFHTVE